MNILSHLHVHGCALPAPRHLEVWLEARVGIETCWKSDREVLYLLPSYIDPMKSPSKTSSPKKSKRPAKVFVPNPLLDGFLTVSLFACTISAFTLFYHDTSLLTRFILLSVGCIVGIRGCKYITSRLGSLVSSTILSGPPFNNPLAKERNLRKLEDQTWQLAAHTLFTVRATSIVISFSR